MNVLKLIPDWVYLAVIAILLAAVGAQQLRVSGLQVDLAQEKQGRSEDRAAAEKAASDHKTALAKLVADHATAQQLKENEYATKLKERSEALARERVVAGGLRSKLAAYTTSGRGTGETDAAAYQRVADRLQVVGGLLAESVDLVTESRGVIRQRDAEVAYLQNQIKIDRAACSPESTP